METAVEALPVLAHGYAGNVPGARELPAGGTGGGGMSDTPRTDAFVAGRDPIRLPHYESMAECIAIGNAVRLLMIDYAEHARQIERELAAARADAQRLNDALSKAQAILDAHRTSANINGIPETSDYANGWNACRQEAYQKRRALIELIDAVIRERARK